MTVTFSTLTSQTHFVIVELPQVHFKLDIFYEKKIELTVSCEKNLKELGSSQLHKETFQRTISRLYEMTISFNK